MLNDIIKEGRELREELKFVPVSPGIIRPHAVYKFTDNARYELWKNISIRFLASEFKGDRCVADFEQAILQLDKRLTPTNFDKLVGIVESCRYISKINSLPSDKTPVNKDLSQPININVSQFQNQEQQQNQKLVLQIFIEAIKDELTGKQQKELRTIIQEERDPIKAKLAIFEKLKSFGENILSNIVANIITNPAIWNGLNL